MLASVCDMRVEASSPPPRLLNPKHLIVNDPSRPHPGRHPTAGGGSVSLGLARVAASSASSVTGKSASSSLLQA